MTTVYIMGLSVIVITILIVIYRRLFGKMISELTLKPAAVKSASSFIEPATETAWWKKLNKVKQLELALFLANITLPVWEKYASSDTAFYKDTTSLLSTAIDKNLLSASLKEIREITPLLPGSDYKKINDCYNLFIGPVIALQDGDWLPPYAVKKIFLSFYNILKGVAETDTNNYNENFFVVAIDHLLDCIDIAKLYTSDQVKGILLEHAFEL